MVLYGTVTKVRHILAADHVHLLQLTPIQMQPLFLR